MPLRSWRAVIFTRPNTLYKSIIFWMYSSGIGPRTQMVRTGALSAPLFCLSRFVISLGCPCAQWIWVL